MRESQIELSKLKFKSEISNPRASCIIKTALKISGIVKAYVYVSSSVCARAAGRVAHVLRALVGRVRGGARPRSVAPTRERAGVSRHPQRERGTARAGFGCVAGAHAGAES